MGCAVINFGDTSRYCNVGHETYDITFGQYSYDNEIGSYCRWIRYAGAYNNLDSGVAHIELPSNSKLTHVYGGNYTTSDASDIWRTITSNDGYVTNATYPQCISLTSNTNAKEVVVWNPADLVKQMGDVQTALQNI